MADSLPAKIVSFRLSTLSLKVLKELSERYTAETSVKISMAKVVELAIFYIQKKKISDILK